MYYLRILLLLVAIVPGLSVPAFSFGGSFFGGVQRGQLSTNDAGFGSDMIGVAGDSVTVTEKLTELSNGLFSVTPQKFGAVVGDGISDSVAIQAAIDYAYSHDKFVFLPVGQYDIDAMIVIPDGVTVSGLIGSRSNLKPFSGGAKIIDSMPVLKLMVDFNIDIVNFVDVYEARLDHVFIDAENQISGDGVVVKNKVSGDKAASGIVIEQVVVWDGYGNLFKTEDNLGKILFKECTAYRSRTQNGFLIDSTDAKIFNSNAFKNFKSGLLISGDNARIENVDSFNNQRGFYVTGINNVFIRIQADYNLSQGIWVTGNLNRFYEIYSYGSNAQAADVPVDVTGSFSGIGTYSDVDISTAVSKCIISGGQIGIVGGGVNNAKFGVFVGYDAALGATKTIKISNFHFNSSYQSAYLSAFAYEQDLSQITTQDTRAIPHQKVITSGTSIDARWGDLIEYAPSSATTLTDIINGVVGQRITLFFSNGNSSLHFGGNLKHGVLSETKAVPNNTAIKFICVDGTRWISDAIDF